MNLTKIERLTLINQFKILKKLENTDDYDENIQILEEGYSFFYRNIFEHLYEDLSEADCKFVRDVLSMYRTIERYKEDSKDVGIAKRPFSHFAGFDGNEESHLLSFALFELSKDNSWDESKPYRDKPYTDGFNSHMPARAIYEQMLAAWTSLGRRHPMSAEDVAAVLGANKPRG